MSLEVELNQFLAFTHAFELEFTEALVFNTGQFVFDQTPRCS